VHTGELFKCHHVDCKFSSSRERTLKAHLLYTHEGASKPSNFSNFCTKCNYKTNRPSKLQDHMIRHEKHDVLVAKNSAHVEPGDSIPAESLVKREDNLYHCRVNCCVFRIMERRSIIRHLKESHKIQVLVRKRPRLGNADFQQDFVRERPRPGNADLQQDFVCEQDLCNFRSVWKAAYKKHLRRIHGLEIDQIAQILKPTRGYSKPRSSSELSAAKLHDSSTSSLASQSPRTSLTAVADPPINALPSVSAQSEARRTQLALAAARALVASASSAFSIPGISKQRIRRVNIAADDSLPAG
jgi:hypothetical protein